MGIPLDSVIVVTFVLGSGIAGLGGMWLPASKWTLCPKAATFSAT